MIFLIGNPGSTNRLTTVSQLEYQRDISLPPRQAYLQSRLAALDGWRQEMPAEAEAADVRNQMFGLSNSLKTFVGRLAALNDPVIMARRADAERALRDSIRAHPALSTQYSALFDRLAAIQQQKRQLAAPDAAFLGLGGGGDASLIRRAIAGVPGHARHRRLGGDPPAAVPRHSETTRRHWSAGCWRRGWPTSPGPTAPPDPIGRAALPDGTPEASAASLLAHSVFADSGRAAQALAGNTMANDPAMKLVAAFMPVYDDYRTRMQALSEQESRPVGRPGPGAVRGVRQDGAAGRDVLAPDRRRRGEGLRVQRHPGPARIPRSTGSTTATAPSRTRRTGTWRPAGSTRRRGSTWRRRSTSSPPPTATAATRARRR